MSNRTSSLLVRRVSAGTDTVVDAGKEFPAAHADAMSGAAAFRIEADILRERARATDEAVIREQYLALADRWAMFAANLEAELMHRVTGMH